MAVVYHRSLISSSKIFSHALFFLVIFQICSFIGQYRIMGQGDSASVLTQAKVWKMQEYWMYFPFFILLDWGKRPAIQP